MFILFHVDLGGCSHQELSYLGRACQVEKLRFDSFEDVQLESEIIF